MNQAVANLSPSPVWTNFERLNEVPRPSKHEERVIAFMKDFGESLGLETIVDGVGNVIVRKPATPGMEDRKGIILQSHLDMVHQKNSDTDFDFSSQGIQSYIDGDWVKAKGTTLGADNGMGVASIMTILAATNMKHGPIEALFTIDEETGMTGAEGLQPGLLEGHILLNLDTEDEGELTIGCAGGIDTNISWNYEEVPTGSGQAFNLTVKGLKGGHSGVDIHLGRGNANKIMNRLMWKGAERFGLRIHRIDGGGLRNAIPREAFATVVVEAAHSEAFQAHVAELTAIVQAELKRSEPGLLVICEAAELPDFVMEGSKQQSLTQALYAAPCGVIRMSDDVPGLVETSTSLARVLVEKGTGKVQFLSRSSVMSAMSDIANSIEATFSLTGAEVGHAGGYPGWQPNAESEILQLMKGLYQDTFGTEAHVVAVHAGLECGIIGKAYPDLDMISFGPTIRNPHSPDEMCEIPTVEKFWRFLVATLEHAPGK